MTHAFPTRRSSDLFSSLARREYPKRNEVRQNELTNFHKSSARAWLCESESKSADFKRKPQKLVFELQIFRSLLPCLGFPHRTSRSEERRVGTECVSTCRPRWSTYQ